MTTATAQTTNKTAKARTGRKPAAKTRTAKAADPSVREQIAAAGDRARRGAEGLRRAGAETIGDARTGIDSAVRRAGKVGREVYLAGLGALATADERGRALFSDLVAQGEKVAPRDVAGPLRQAGSRLGARLERFGGRLESALEKGVQSGLERLGVPSRREIHQLTRRIEALSAKIDRVGA